MQKNEFNGEDSFDPCVEAGLVVTEKVVKLSTTGGATAPLSKSADLEPV